MKTAEETVAEWQTWRMPDEDDYGESYRRALVGRVAREYPDVVQHMVELTQADARAEGRREGLLEAAAYIRARLTGHEATFGQETLAHWALIDAIADELKEKAEKGGAT